GSGPLLLALEAAAQTGAGVAEVLPQVAGAHGLGHLLPPGPAQLAQVALEQEGAHEHDEEADEPEQEAGRKRRDQQAEAGDEAESRPLEVAPGVLVEGGRADLTRECGVVLVELLLDLLEDPLLVLRQRHACLATSRFFGGRPYESIFAHPTEANNARTPDHARLRRLCHDPAPTAGPPGASSASLLRPPGWRAPRRPARSGAAAC